MSQNPSSGAVILPPAGAVGRPSIPCLALDPLPLEVDNLELNLTLNDGRFVAVAPSEEIRGLLFPFSSRARVVLCAMLSGFSIRMSATKAGISLTTIDRWREKVPEWSEAETKAREWGFAGTFESELHHIAMDRTHRGQVRALELVTKSRAPEYREKQQLEISLVQKALQAEASIGAGWDAAQLPSPSSNVT